MFDLEPGPLARLDPASLRPFPSRASFVGLVAQARETLGDLDAYLTPYRGYVMEGNADAVDAAYVVTVLPARAEVANQLLAFAVSPSAALAAAGQPIDGLRDRVLPHLPPPDTDVQMDFTDPPTLEQIDTDDGTTDWLPGTSPGME
jgi:hypothetical protein